MKYTDQQIAQMYRNAQQYFQQTHPEWICTIEGPYLVVQLNWMNSVYFNGMGVAHEVRTYRHLVEILPDGRFKTIDAASENEQSIGLNGISLSSNAFAGKQFTYHVDARVGVDTQTGQTGLITYKFNNMDIKQPVKEYFQGIGLKYKSMNSLRDEFNALAGPTKLGIGIVFAIVGLIFLAVVAFFTMNAGMEITQVVNGVKTVTTIGEMHPVLRIVFTIFPLIFIGFSIAAFVSYNRHNRPAAER